MTLHATKKKYFSNGYSGVTNSSVHHCVSSMEHHVGTLSTLCWLKKVFTMKDSRLQKRDSVAE